MLATARSEPTVPVAVAVATAGPLGLRRLSLNTLFYYFMSNLFVNALLCISVVSPDTPLSR